MNKILVCTDGRDFQVIACAFTSEDKQLLENSGYFDQVTEFELVGEVPKLRPSLETLHGPLTPDQRFSLFIKGQQAKLVQGEPNFGVEQDAEGFEMTAAGFDQDLITSIDELEELLNQ